VWRDCRSGRELRVGCGTARLPRLVDFRETEGWLSIGDLYQLASELGKYGDTFHRKVALLVTPGTNFDQASFFETCSHNRGFSIDAFTDYEKAIHWILSSIDISDINVAPKNPQNA
jgi:hypothetical protein